MQFQIKFDGNINPEISEDLKELEQLMKDDYGIVSIPEKQKPQIGVKDSGLTIGLAIAGLALTGIQTVIAAIQYWQSQRPKYTLSIICRDEIYILNNANKEDIDKIMKAIHYLPNSITEEIEIKISKK
jgi:hypothetical protein